MFQCQSVPEVQPSIRKSALLLCLSCTLSAPHVGGCAGERMSVHEKVASRDSCALSVGTLIRVAHLQNQKYNKEMYEDAPILMSSHTHKHFSFLTRVLSKFVFIRGADVAATKLEEMQKKEVRKRRPKKGGYLQLFWKLFP